jgi:sulfane dehydrogenase subunit SoxC
VSAAGVDGRSRSLPAKAWRDALLAHDQNGAPLRRAQGFPLRLIVPGWQGHTPVKWLCRLDVAERPRGASDDRVMPAQSVITFPSGGRQLPGPGHYEISGLAWSGRGPVARVEVSTDGGRRWAPAALQEPVLPVCHTRFRHPWRWDGGPAVLQSRCRDETGDVQPQRGPARNRIWSWLVAEDDGVGNRHG